MRRKKWVKEDSPEAILLVKKNCLETEAGIFDNNLKLLETLLKGFIPTGAGSIMAGLPENLREYFNMSAGMPSVYSSKEIEQWAEADYE